MIKNLVFDLGGVLINGDDEIFFRNTIKVEKLLNTSRSQLVKTWNNPWLKFRIGKITEDEFFMQYAQLAQDTNNYGDIVQHLKKIWRQEVKALPLLKELEKLKTRYYLYGLSNISKEWLAYKTKKLALNSKLIKVYSSCEEGVAKPDLKIYKAMLKKSGINPEESIFIDDSERNTSAAKRVVFKTIHFTSTYLFKEKLHRFLSES